MAPPNNPDVARITVVYNRDTRFFQNTFHLYRTGGWSEAQLIATLEGVYDVWHVSALPAMPIDVKLYNIRGVVYDPDGSPWVHDRFVSPAEPGTRGASTEASNVTLALSERANLAGRAYRGRIYWPGLISSDVLSGDTASSGLLALLVAFFTNWLSVFNAPTSVGKLVLFHRNDNLFTPVSTGVIDALVDSMRSRLPGRGR